MNATEDSIDETNALLERVAELGTLIAQGRRIVYGEQHAPEEVAMARVAARYLDKLRAKGYAKEQARWAYWRKCGDLVRGMDRSGVTQLEEKAAVNRQADGSSPSPGANVRGPDGFFTAKETPDG